MSAADFWNNQDRAQSIVEELKDLKGILKSSTNLETEIGDQLDMAELLMEESNDDASMLADLEQSVIDLEKEFRAFRISVTLDSPVDKLNVFLSIHSGAGGTEACDWAQMLLRMYLRWLEERKWKYEILDENPDIEAGYKSVMIRITGRYAYGYLKGEIGVHRLVRISPFDSKSRRHTSFAAVDVIPEYADEGEIEVLDKDIRVDTYRASGAGGQHVNKTDSAVRITHLTSGIVVQCQAERSQHKNRSMAMKILKARLEHMEQVKKDQKIKEMYGDKGEIAWGNQIRSYVETPYTMVRDHRSELKRTDYEKVMNGDITEFMTAYLEMNIKA